MNLLLFLLVITVSFIIVRIGAIAFNLTGLDWSLAKFQALSCFSGTGFTTRESELVVSHPKRRQIASILMVLGNAGLVTLVATFANSMRPRAGAVGWQIPFTDIVVPAAWYPLINLIVIVLVLTFLFRYLHSTHGSRLTALIRKVVVRRQEQVQKVSFGDLTVITSGYGVIRIPVTANLSIRDQTILNSGLKSKGVLILAVVRASETLPNPPIDTVIREFDELICFGHIDQMRSHFEKEGTS